MKSKIIKVVVLQAIPFTDHKEGDRIEISQSEYDKNPTLFKLITSDHDFKIGDRVVVYHKLEEISNTFINNYGKEGDIGYAINYSGHITKITDRDSEDFIHIDGGGWCVSYKTLEKCAILSDFGGNTGVLVPSLKVVVYNNSNTVTFESIKKLADKFRNIQTEIDKITEEYIDEEEEYKINMADFSIGDINCNFGCHTGYVGNILNIAKELEQYENN